MMAEGQRRRLVTDIPAGLAGSKVDRKPLKVQGGEKQVLLEGLVPSESGV